MSVNYVQSPTSRRLRGYAFDPSLSIQLDTALVNETVFKVHWEEILEKGPVGEYLEVVDFDPASDCFYEPVDLNNNYILAQDGVQPSESSPQFHQQMVYAVAMTTIQNFEKALGRKTLWSAYNKGTEKDFLKRLRIYPHALREKNAYYSPLKKALLFGYFPAADNAPGEYFPNGIVFTCLSHDIIAHETTHALLDGMHRRFIEASHPDTLSFHEAFADIVALFQHFTFPEVLRHQIAKTRGDLASQNLLGQLAQQFGKAIGHYGALRDAIGDFDETTNQWKPRVPNPNDYQTTTEPHDRGAILVAAIFEAFLAIYKCRAADLLRIATSGTGILPAGELHPDLVNRLAKEANKTAQQILNICIRALDYCPPVDITFGDYLRAIITADMDLVPDDDLGYRVAMIEAFRRRGIYPRDIRTLSEESLRWQCFEGKQQQGIFRELATEMRPFVHHLDYLDEFPSVIDNSVNRQDWLTIKDREKIFHLTRAARIALHSVLVRYKTDANSEEMKNLEEITGLYLVESERSYKNVPEMKAENGKFPFEVHSFRNARRISPDGNSLNQIIISITQTRRLKKSADNEAFKFRGGCTLILNLQDLSLRYVVKKRIDDIDGRLTRQRQYRTGDVGTSLRATYFGNINEQDGVEPFAFLHRGF